MATAKKKQQQRADEMDDGSDMEEDDENLRDFNNSMDSCNNNKTQQSQTYGVGHDIQSGHGSTHAQ